MSTFNLSVWLPMVAASFLLVSCSGGSSDSSGSGGQNGADTAPPVISGVQSQAISANSVTIVWTTDESATSRVEYGPSSAYGSTQDAGTARVTRHSIQLTNLQPATLYYYRVISEDANGNRSVDAARQFVTSSVQASCTKGVDCYCDRNRQLIACEDFADGRFGNVQGFCSNNGGPWPNCSFISHQAVLTGGYRDTSQGINDDGAILSTLRMRSTGQMAAGLSLVFSTPLTDGEGSFGVLMKAGPTFWEAFSSANKFIAFRPSSDDPRQVVFFRPADQNGANGCVPGTYSVPNASGGGGAARSYDEFGNANPFDSRCRHTIKFGNNLANQWVYLEWEIHSLSSGRPNVMHVWLRDGTVMRALAPVTTATTQRSVEMFHWQEEATNAPDGNSYVYIDLMRVSNSYMGPPPGFLQ